jgi:hypothetical protein
VTSTTSSEAVSASRIAVHGVVFGNPDRAVTVIDVATFDADPARVVSTAVEE